MRLVVESWMRQLFTTHLLKVALLVPDLMYSLPNHAQIHHSSPSIKLSPHLTLVHRPMKLKSARELLSRFQFARHSRANSSQMLSMLRAERFTKIFVHHFHSLRRWLKSQPSSQENFQPHLMLKFAEIFQVTIHLSLLPVCLRVP